MDEHEAALDALNREAECDRCYDRGYRDAEYDKVCEECEYDEEDIYEAERTAIRDLIHEYAPRLETLEWDIYWNSLRPEQVLQNLRDIISDLRNE